MKRILFVVLAMHPFAGHAMLSKYTNWIHQRETNNYKTQVKNLQSSNYVYTSESLKDLHAQLDRHASNQILIKYFILPGAVALSATGMILALAQR